MQVTVTKYKCLFSCHSSTKPHKLKAAVRWRGTTKSLEEYQVSQLCCNSVSLGYIQPLTEEIPKEFPLRVKSVRRLQLTTLAYIIIYLLTYLLTPWCRVLLEKRTVLQLVKKLPAFHGTQRFITAITSVRHLYVTVLNTVGNCNTMLL